MSEVEEICDNVTIMRTGSVVYHGEIPDLFRVGRDVTLSGSMRNGVFVADKDSMVTKCPSKYAPATKKTT